MPPMIFRDREDAGRQLAARLAHLKDQDPVVLGLPRGGVVVAEEIARSLDAPMDVLVVRKIGAPHQPELALGAVTDSANPHVVLNDDIVRLVAPSREFIDREIAEQVDELRRRETLYRGGRAAEPLKNRTVIVADDGIATGATVRAGLQALRRVGPRRLVLAVPVGPPDTLREIESEVDELVYLYAPDDFRAVGVFYEKFDQTSDEQVIALLDRALA